MVSDSRLKFYLTPKHDCSYFSDREATTLFADPRARIDLVSFSALTQNGFRRSGDYIYRPHCEICNACQSIRIPVEQFKASKSQRRIWKKNSDLEISIKSPAFTEENYELYVNYINSRHNDGDMFPASETQYRSFLLAPFESARFVEFRKNDALIGVSVIDLLPDSISAIYTFFDPEESHRSLGSYAILWLLDCCRVEELPYLYLGYYIADSRKMNYKTRFQPYELLVDDNWLPEPVNAD